MSQGKMIDSHLLKLRARDDISPEEEAAIRGAVAETVSIAAHRTIIRAWQDLDHSVLLLEGWIARVKDVESGARQVTEIHVPGDFADLHAFTLKKLDHDVVALTKCELALVPHDRLKEITAAYPHLARVYWFTTNLDAAIHREWMLSFTRRSALARLAHLFCELLVRLGLIGRADPGGYDFPLTQGQLAECLGLTPVHINRTLQEMRQRRLIELANRRLTILDLPALQRIAEFDPAYLYLEKRAR